MRALLYSKLNQGGRVMWGTSYSRARQAQTTIVCRECGGTLRAERTCHDVYLRCTACNKVTQVQEHIDEMDEALESFMENVFCDRV
jgi:ribosomal protein L32